MRRILNLIILVGLFLPTMILAQGSGTLEITKVVPNQRLQRYDLYVKAFTPTNTDLFPLLEGTDQPTYNREGLTVAVRSEDNNTADSLQIVGLQVLANENPELRTVQSNPRILFLMDLSGSMRGTKLTEAKNAIRIALESDALSRCVTEFAWFHNFAGATRTVTAASYDAVVEPVKIGPRGKDTDIHRALLDKVNEYVAFPGQKVIILLTDGVQDIAKNPLYYGSDALSIISQSDLLSIIREQTRDSLLQIFPVGIGNAPDESFLKAINEATASPHDNYWSQIRPEDITQTFQQIVRDISAPNFIISVQPERKKGRIGSSQQTLLVNYRIPSSNQMLADWLAFQPSITIADDIRETSNYWITAIIGLILLSVLLGILSVIIPITSDKQFRKKHIRRYAEVRIPNVQKRDPLTKINFEDHDEVVVNEMGDKVMALTTWKFYREKGRENEVGDYLELFPPQVKASQFFSQRGTFRQFNWLWFGALGGFLAWCFYEFFQSFELIAYKTLLETLDTNDLQISGAVFNETILGLALGAGIIISLAWVEESGQSRKFNFGRVLLRLILGMVSAYFIFFITAALLAKFIPSSPSSPWIRSFIGWTLFGTAMGIILSFFSSIPTKSAFKGGVLAGIIAFVLYSILNHAFFHSFLDSQTVAIISFIGYGGVLGYALHTVVSALEDYELRCLSPKEFAMWQSPISKWLKSPKIDYILIGKHPKNRVYVKWEDRHVADMHARLSLIKNVPHIAPDQGEVLVNNVRISGPTPLENGDKIKLGPQSISILQFLSKENQKKGTKPATSVANNGRISLKVKPRSKQDERKIRKQIKINRK